MCHFFPNSTMPLICIKVFIQVDPNQLNSVNGTDADGSCCQKFTFVCASVDLCNVHIVQQKYRRIGVFSGFGWCILINKNVNVKVIKLKFDSNLCYPLSERERDRKSYKSIDSHYYFIYHKSCSELSI